MRRYDEVLRREPESSEPRLWSTALFRGLPILLLTTLALSGCGLGGDDDDAKRPAGPATKAPPVLGQPAEREEAAEDAQTSDEETGPANQNAQP